MVRAVFFGSSDSVFSNRHFAPLMDGGCEVAAVVDVPPDRRASTNAARQDSESFVQIARRRGIPCYEPANPNAAPFVEEIRSLAPDLFMAVGYMLLLKPPLLSVPRVVAANLHASLLPAYRGRHPVFWALRNSEPWCGLTIHEMASGLDTGDIIFQVRVPTREDDSVATLYERIMTESVPLVPRLVAGVANGSLPRRPQSEAGASYCGATRENDFRITWSMDAATIARWVTATPGQCFAEVGAQRVFLLDARFSGSVGDSRPGTLLRRGVETCLIAATRGAVEIRRLRAADGRDMSADDAFLDAGLAEGSVLGGS